MTKAELLAALRDMPDDVEITVVVSNKTYETIGDVEFHPITRTINCGLSFEHFDQD
jgi:hypothetical protein